LINFFYACNNEYGKTMDRIFIDIDRQDNGAQDAQRTAATLVKTIQKDKAFSKLMKYKIFIIRTGSSFHVLLMLKKTMDHAMYDRYFSRGPKRTESFITKRADEVSKQT
jgi:lipopolysaccharide biosynthesis regulator YciM